MYACVCVSVCVCVRVCVCVCVCDILVEVRVESDGAPARSEQVHHRGRLGICGGEVHIELERAVRVRRSFGPAREMSSVNIAWGVTFRRHDFTHAECKTHAEINPTGCMSAICEVRSVQVVTGAFLHRLYWSVEKLKWDPNFSFYQN